MLCLVAQTLCDPMDYNSPSSSVHGDSPGKNTGEFPCPPPRDLPNPGIKPRSPTLQVDSLPSELPGKCHLNATVCNCIFSLSKKKYSANPSQHTNHDK